MRKPRDYAKVKAAKLRRRQTLEGKITFLLGKARKNAKKYGVECTLTRDWLKRQIERGTCAQTGMAFVWPDGKSQVGQHFAQNPWSPSLDRITPGGPYSNKNCRVTTWIYNSARGRWSDDDLAKMCQAYLAVRLDRALPFWHDWPLDK